MRSPIVLVTLLSLTLPVVTPVFKVMAEENHNVDLLLADRRAGGAKKSGGQGIDRSRMGATNSNRIDRSQSAPRRNVDRPQDRKPVNNIDREQARERVNNVRPQDRKPVNNIDREQARERVNNVDRDRVQNRVEQTNIDRDKVRNRVDRDNINLDNDRNYSNRIDKDNIGNRVRIGNNNVVVNPRRYNSWGWNGGSIWSPNTGYWGGGFWGAFAVGTVTGLATGAVINELSNDDPTYVIVQQNTPGYRLLTDYGLTQTACRDNVVEMYGPNDSLICAIPTSNIPAGVYYIDTENLTLITR